MRLLLDTQTLLWFGLDDARLSSPARALIEDGNNQVAVSPASYWEIAIKIALGKYVLTQPYEPFFQHVFAANAMTILPVEIRHTAILTTLPQHHRDPFDRLIIAQALAEGLPIVGNDSTFDAYGVTRLW
jgi:PIN domain nuclease of toxin-antitoxin system